MRLLAYMIRRGDVVLDGDRQREVKSVRTDRRARDHTETVVFFKSGLPLKVDSESPVRVRREWRTRSREGRR
ncbi:hypothetical protein CTZ27_04725 [Streptomyces griseocarneus]|nr:hypothetical protein CTZ27_04725 [Streptomyces griseocarneus]